jgi:hypothetical protein
MASPILLLAVLVVAALAGVVGYAMGYLSAARSTRDDGRPLPEVAERDAFIEHLRELAWQHRDVSPELSTIVIDEISQRHRRGQLPGGPTV